MSTPTTTDTVGRPSWQVRGRGQGRSGKLPQSASLQFRIGSSLDPQPPPPPSLGSGFGEKRNERPIETSKTSTYQLKSHEPIIKAWIHEMKVFFHLKKLVCADLGAPLTVTILLTNWKKPIVKSMPMYPYFNGTRSTYTRLGWDSWPILDMFGKLTVYRELVICPQSQPTHSDTLIVSCVVYHVISTRPLVPLRNRTLVWSRLWASGQCVSGVWWLVAPNIGPSPTGLRCCMPGAACQRPDVVQANTEVTQINLPK